jgi:predicted TIM-barrel fold metal-dependent hydrolase
MVTCDAHATEPFDYLQGRIPTKFLDRIPHIRVDEDGSQWLIVEGWRPQIVKPAGNALDHLPPVEEYEDYDVLMPYTKRMEPEDLARASVKPGLETRLANLDLDGIDYELCFPMKGLPIFATPDPEFAAAMCHGWNEWALEEYGASERILPMAMVSPADLKSGLAEIRWAAEHGFKGVMLPNRPVYGPVTDSSLQYNDKSLEPLWAALEEAGLVVTFHVSTGSDPRSTAGNGGAIINYVSHSMVTTIEPLVHLIASGVFERHRSLRAGSVESGVGWVPWALESMDHAYRAHHMWVRPVIPEKPSTYFRSNCFATFIEDNAGMALVERFGLEDNFLWSNDYPHQEGSWPHSEATIRRGLDVVSETTRRKLLGLNAARIFNLPVPEGKD